MRTILPIILLVVLLAFGFYLAPVPDESQPPVLNDLGTGEINILLGSVVAQDLRIPWAIGQLPGGEILVTERPGRLVKIGANQQVIPIEGVHTIGEGGLMGLAVHPNFATNHWIYLQLTAQSGGKVINRVERYKLEDNAVKDRKIIIDNIPGASIHDGGRIAFGPDQMLYITTGDANTPALAQDKNSLAGKILRVSDEGGIPADNPFGNAVYSYGHRNPQGLAWDSRDRLWSTEHGPSGSQTGYDEINLIQKGGNYGWPTYKGDDTAEGIISPIKHSGGNETWAPAGLAYVGGWLVFGGLRGETLYAMRISGDKVVDTKTFFVGEFGRIREVWLGADKSLYITTSNRDGRGTIRAGDDKLIQLKVSI